MTRMNTRIFTFGLVLLATLSAPVLAQDKAAPAAKPTTPAPAVATPAAAAPTVAPVAAAAPPAKPATAAATNSGAAAPKTPAPIAGTAPVAPMTAEAKAPAAKKRVIKRKPNSGCTKLDDPWDNICAIKKNAELACADLPAGKNQAKKAKKGSAPASTENKRAQCVEGYMRNV